MWLKSGQIISTTQHSQNHVGNENGDKFIYRRQKFVVVRLFMNHCILLPILNTKRQGLRSKNNLDEQVSIRDRNDIDPTPAETIHGALFCRMTAHYISHPDPNFGFADNATVHFTASESFGYGSKYLHIGDLEPDSKHRLIGLWLCYLTARMTHEFPNLPDQEDMQRILDDERRKAQASEANEIYAQKVREFEELKEQRRMQDMALRIQEKQTKALQLSNLQLGNEHKSVFSTMAEKVKQLGRSSSLGSKGNGNSPTTQQAPREQNLSGRTERSSSLGRPNEVEYRGRVVGTSQNTQGSSTNARPSTSLGHTGNGARENIFAQVNFGELTDPNAYRDKPLPAPPQGGAQGSSSSRRPNTVPRGAGPGLARDGSYYF